MLDEKLIVMSVIKIIPLGKENYDTWKIHMRALLIKTDTWKYVSGELLCPQIREGKDETEVAHNKWCDDDQKVCSDLILNIAP